MSIAHYFSTCCSRRAEHPKEDYKEFALIKTTRFLVTHTNPAFPCGIEKALNYEIVFKDLEKVLNLAKMYIMISIEKVGNYKVSRLFIQILFITTDDSFIDVFCIVFCQ